MEKFSWSLSVGSTSGVTAGDTGSAEMEAVTSIPLTLEPNMQNTLDLDVQLDDVDKLELFLLSSTLYDGKVEVQGNDQVVKLTGPLLLFGDSIKNFSSSLDVLKLQNKHADKKAEIKILIGRKLTA